MLNNRRPLVFYGRSGRETKKFVEWKLARVFDNNSELPVNRIKKKKKKKSKDGGWKIETIALRGAGEIFNAAEN